MNQFIELRDSLLVVIKEKDLEFEDLYNFEGFSKHTEFILGERLGYYQGLAAVEKITETNKYKDGIGIINANLVYFENAKQSGGIDLKNNPRDNDAKLSMIFYSNAIRTINEVKEKIENIVNSEMGNQLKEWSALKKQILD